MMGDAAYRNDTCMGWPRFRLDRFPTGLALLRLKGFDGRANGGVLLIESLMTKRSRLGQNAAICR